MHGRNPYETAWCTPDRSQIIRAEKRPEAPRKARLVPDPSNRARRFRLLPARFHRPEKVVPGLRTTRALLPESIQRVESREELSYFKTRRRILNPAVPAETAVHP